MNLDFVNVLTQDKDETNSPQNKKVKLSVIKTEEEVIRKTEKTNDNESEYDEINVVSFRRSFSRLQANYSK